MRKDYNSQAFRPEDVEKGLHLKLLNTLLELNKESEDGYNDIHITTDGYCTIIEWCFRFYEDLGEGRFDYIGPDEYIMIEKRFPDDHYEYFSSEEEYQECLAEWLKENPGWVKTEYGTWTNEIENEKFRKELEKQTKRSE